MRQAKKLPRLPGGRALSCMLVVALLLNPAGHAAPEGEAGDGIFLQALQAMRDGDLQRARELFEQVAARTPRHGGARFQLGWLAFERGDLEAARVHLEVAVTSNLQGPHRAWSLLGRVHLASHDPAAALDCFTRALETAPRFGPALQGRARAALFLHRFDQALSDLELAATAADSGHARLLAAQTLAYLNRPSEALEQIALLENEAGEAGGLEISAKLLRLALDTEPGAGTELRLLLGKNISLADGHQAWAVRRILTGSTDTAITLLRIAGQMDDGNPVTWLWLHRLGVEKPLAAITPFPDLERSISSAYRLFERDEFEQAVQTARSVLERRPLHVPAHLLMIRDAERRDDLWTALAGYRQLLLWLPGLPALQARLADIAHAMALGELAECSVRGALEALPEDGPLHYRLATILADRSDFEAAAAACRKAIDLGVADVNVWMLLGKVSLDRMDFASAISAYSHALELAPETAEAIGSFVLSSLTTSESASLRGLLERYAETRPDSADTLYSLGVMSLREGDLDAAERYLLQVANLRPDHSEVQYNLSVVYRRLGLEEQGRAAMARFRDLKAVEDDDWLRHNQAHAIRLDAEAALASGDSERAVGLYLRIVADGTAHLEDYVNLGQAHLKSANYATALALFQNLLATTPYDARLLGGLANAAMALGEEEIGLLARKRLELLAMSCSEAAPESSEL